MSYVLLTVSDAPVAEQKKAITAPYIEGLWFRAAVPLAAGPTPGHTAATYTPARNVVIDFMS